jgi:hypothetical protein
MTRQFTIALRAASAVLLLGALAACDRSPPSEAVPAPEPAATPETPGTPAPDTAPAPEPSEQTPPGDASTAPAQPESTPPPPEEPSAVPKPTAAPAEPALESMLAAKASSKLGVPVSLRYQFDAAPLPGQPVTLHLAAVPRVPGSNLKVAVTGAQGLKLASSTSLRVQKAAAADVYRQQLSVTRSAEGPRELLVLVTMDLQEGSGFGYFSIPLAGEQVAGKTARKPDSVKPR